MRRATIFILCCALVAGCTGELGGGGVNTAEEREPSTTVAAPTTTTSSLAPTTTTTLPTYLINGRIVRGSGSPVAAATVTMGEESVQTGADGSFNFETNAPKDMTVSKNGWTSADIVWDEAAAVHMATIDLDIVRGLRVSPDAAADDNHFASLVTLAAKTAVNALVFDTKQEGGKVLYDTAVQAAVDSGAVDVIYDPVSRIIQAHENGLYAITRIVTFEDSVRVKAFPDEKLAGVWLDPASATARGYNLELATEACLLGFDEVQFDYVRYPSGQTATISGQLDLTQEERVSAIARFLAEARALLEPMGCSVSAAIFGIVASTPNDQGLGQRPEELSAELDAVSPMVYPSHYAAGWLGFEDPNAHPYDVTANALSDALPRMAARSHLRPWLQAFWWSNEQIRQSIQAAEDLGVGWILWNIRSNFDAEALPTDAEVIG